MTDGGARREARIELWGWLLFVGSAGFFVVSALRSGDAVALAGSLLFLAACFVFLYPRLAARARNAAGTARPPSRRGTADG